MLSSYDYSVSIKKYISTAIPVLIEKGVKMIAPETVFFSKDTKIGKNVTIEPYVVIGSKVKIGNNVIIKSFSHLENCKIENKVEIGPYARIRPGTTLKEGSKIGNFVEIKKSTLGKKSKVNHLTYIGDSYIGKSVNIGKTASDAGIGICFGCHCCAHRYSAWCLYRYSPLFMGE